jgi:hypothetical protein
MSRFRTGVSRRCDTAAVTDPTEAPDVVCAHPRWLGEWTSALLQFVALLDADRWHRRVRTLLQTEAPSPYEAKITSDHFLVEFELAALSRFLRDVGRLPDMLPRRSMAVLEFEHEAVATSSGALNRLKAEVQLSN